MNELGDIIIILIVFRVFFGILGAWWNGEKKKDNFCQKTFMSLLSVNCYMYEPATLYDSDLKLFYKSPNNSFHFSS
mgnify:CR=1 FL=1